MTDYKRLTKYKGEPLHTDMEVTDGDEIYDRLAELEDKIENGTLVQLPCKVGDRIWAILGNNVFGRKVKRIEICQNYYCIYTSDKTGWKDLEIYYQTEFGIIWFINRAEAEARLAELRGVK